MYKLNTLTTSILHNFLIELYKEGYSKNYLDMIMTMLKTSLKYAVYPLEYIQSSPAQYLDIKRFKYNESEDLILTKEDMYEIFKFVREFKPLAEIFYKILYMTGMRLSEVCGLTWDNIDFDNRIIKVRQQMQFQTGRGNVLVALKTKSSKRDINFGDTLYDELILHKNKLESLGIYSTFVCAKENGNAMYKSDVEKINNAINNNLMRFKTHSVRKLHATMLIEGGADIKDVSARLGHSSTKISYDIYVKNTKLLKDKTVRIFESIL